MTTTGAALAELVASADEVLAPQAFADAAHNGLQVEGRPVVSTVCTAVDASLAAVEQAVAAGADALLVHHGLLWGHASPLTGRLGGVVRALFRADISLLAYHIPLDAHPTLGNNAVLADLLGLTERAPFGAYKGSLIGQLGTLRQPLAPTALQEQLATSLAATVQLHQFNSSLVSRVGVVSGRACDEALLTEARDAGVDHLLTGEMVHESWHVARELGISVIAAGHYATETHGVAALGEHLATRLGLHTRFLDIPTGL